MTLWEWQKAATLRSGSRLMANRSPAKSCLLSAITRQPAWCMCQASRRMPALCEWGFFGSNPGSVAVDFKLERGKGGLSSHLTSGRLLGLTVYSVNLNCVITATSLPKRKRRISDSLFLRAFQIFLSLCIFMTTSAKHFISSLNPGLILFQKN